MARPRPHTPTRGHLLRLLGPLLLGVAALACEGGGADVIDERGLSGRVLDDLTDDGLAGATVVFVSDTLDESRTVTDGRGRFDMTVELSQGVRLGHLFAEAAGYQRSPRVSVYFDGTERTAELRLRPAADDE